MTIIASLSQTLVDISDSKELSDQSEATRKLFNKAFTDGQDPDIWKNGEALIAYTKTLGEITDKFSELQKESMQEIEKICEMTSGKLEPAAIDALNKKLAKAKDKLNLIEELHDIIFRTKENIKSNVPNSPYGVGQDMVELLEIALDNSTKARAISLSAYDEAIMNLSSDQTNHLASSKNANSDQGNCCNIM